MLFSLCSYMHFILYKTTLPKCLDLKAGTHWPKCWTSETFGETRTNSRTNLFGVFSCVGSFWNRADGIWSYSTCKVCECWRSEDWAPLDTLIGGVLANQCRPPCVGGAEVTMVCTPSFPVFMFWISGTRLALPDFKETYCISLKRRMYILLCSWQ